MNICKINAIMTGWRVGAKDFDACDKGTKKTALIGMAIDECVRAVFMVARWQTGIWRKKGLIREA